MTLAALIAAYHESDDAGGGLRATLPLAGRTLLERQARLAQAVGAAPVVILVERLPADLVAAIDRLRGEGVAVEVARSVADAAQAVQADDRLLLLADGMVGDEAHFARILSAGGAAVMTIPDLGADDRFERIDAQSRWAGLAVIDGRMLKQTAAMLEDWDLQSTLLRRAVQAGARQFSAKGPPGAPLIIAVCAADLAEPEARIVAQASGSRADWVSRFLLSPVEASAARALMPTRVSVQMLGILGSVLTAGGAFFFAYGWLWTGLAALLVATPLDGIAERLARLRMQPRRGGNWWGYLLLPALAALALLALGYALTAASGWGCVGISVTAILFLLALRGETGPASINKTFLAERKGMTWLMLPFAVTGLWVAGLAALAGYAAASFFWAQRQVHIPVSAPSDD